MKLLLVIGCFLLLLLKVQAIPLNIEDGIIQQHKDGQHFKPYYGPLPTPDRKPHFELNSEPKPEQQQPNEDNFTPHPEVDSEAKTEHQQPNENSSEIPNAGSHPGPHHEPHCGQDSDLKSKDEQPNGDNSGPHPEPYREPPSAQDTESKPENHQPNEKNSEISNTENQLGPHCEPPSEQFLVPNREQQIINSKQVFLISNSIIVNVSTIVEINICAD